MEWPAHLPIVGGGVCHDARTNLPSNLTHEDGPSLCQNPESVTETNKVESMSNQKECCYNETEIRNPTLCTKLPH